MQPGNGFSQNGNFNGWSVNGSDYLRITVRDGNIINIQKTEPPEGNQPRIYIAPGLIDTQVNGYISVSFSEAGLTPEKIHKVAEALYKQGVTSFFPTLITGPPDLTRENLKILSEATREGLPAHVIPGFFLEGPYISPEEGYRGVHDPEWIRPAGWEEFETFVAASGNRILQVGLAPEIPGAMDFIRRVVEHGMMVSLAHHNAGKVIIGEAVKAGARVSTHLGNGCANLIHRHDNPIWPQLANDNLTASLIADGHHLTTEELEVFLRAKGPGKIILVSDMTELAGMPAGNYTWNGKEVILTDDGALLYPHDQVLAGASFPLKKGVMNMSRLKSCSLPEAFDMATLNPARLYNLSDRGELKEGLSADLILFTMENGNLEIQETLVKGISVYKKEAE